ncbi:hypothetical protein Glove_232g95 [Diversispora epigaea]|uniref:Uncharacterized protein n=1 Tax=Diversispora epigaea TaxID=1348612 RepID=A0A397IIN0_9GLOM|nr:hypothetical protein Glove_232g95 [Diversispora epigaea]
MSRLFSLQISLKLSLLVSKINFISICASREGLRIICRNITKARLRVKLDDSNQQCQYSRTEKYPCNFRVVLTELQKKIKKSRRFTARNKTNINEKIRINYLQGELHSMSVAGLLSHNRNRPSGE